MMLTKEQIEKQLAYWRSNPGHGPTFADFELVAETALDALAEVQWLREAVAQSDHVVAEWAEASQTNYQRAKAAEAERDAALARVEKLRHQITEASDPDFIWGALDNVHDAETTLDDYAAAVSRAIRAAIATHTGKDGAK